MFGGRVLVGGWGNLNPLVRKVWFWLKSRGPLVRDIVRMKKDCRGWWSRGVFGGLSSNESGRNFVWRVGGEVDRVGIYGD